MEFKSCEERVLWELTRAENKIENMKDNEIDYEIKMEKLKEHYEAELAKYKRFFEVVSQRMQFNTTNDEHQYLSFESVWQKWDTEIYNELVKLVSGLGE